MRSRGILTAEEKEANNGQTAKIGEAGIEKTSSDAAEKTVIDETQKALDVIKQ